MNKIVFLLPALALAACAETSAYPVQLEGQAEAVSAARASPVESIKLTSEDTINGGRYTVLGEVNATVGKVTAFHPTPSVAQVEQKLRIEAGKQGADAVIGVTTTGVEVCAFSWGCRHATGTAVKLTQ